MYANPEDNKEWKSTKYSVPTDGIHARDNVSTASPEMYSEAIKKLKPLLLVKIIAAFKMDQVSLYLQNITSADVS